MQKTCKSIVISFALFLPTFIDKESHYQDYHSEDDVAYLVAVFRGLLQQLLLSLYARNLRQIVTDKS